MAKLVPTSSTGLAGLKLKVDRNQQFADFWRTGVLQQGRVPLRSDFKPERIPMLWSNLITHDLSSGDDSILIQVGTALVERFGDDPTGKSYLTVVMEERRKSALAALQAMARQPCGMLVEIDWVYASGMCEKIESIGFPMWRTPEGGGEYLVFCNHVVGKPIFDFIYRDPENRFAYAEATDRTYIDIGFGTP